MAFLSSLNISGSALTAQKFRMDVISSNIANASTTRTEDGGPYIKKSVVFEEQDNSFNSIFNSLENGASSGVKVSEVLEDTDAVKKVYDPDNPDADANGYVLTPDINTVEEMTDMMSATRSYQANVTVFNAVKLMATAALEIGR